jgi:hypothetical protein
MSADNLFWESQQVELGEDYILEREDPSESSPVLLRLVLEHETVDISEITREKAEEIINFLNTHFNLS